MEKNLEQANPKIGTFNRTSERLGNEQIINVRLVKRMGPRWLPSVPEDHLGVSGDGGGGRRGREVGKQFARIIDFNVMKMCQKYFVINVLFFP